MTPRRFVLRASLFASLSLASCLTPAPSHYVSPDERLEALLSQLNGVSDDAELDSAEISAAEGVIRDSIRGLALKHPRHVPVLVANASLAYEAGDSIGAQRYLDQALVVDPVHVPGTLLRVRIAAEEGNLPFARRKLTELLAVYPDDVDLREAHAGVLYLQGDLDAAAGELDVADRLRPGGGPTWRTAYHRGLIAEALGDTEAAAEHYRLSVDLNPDFDASARRARWTAELVEGGPVD